MRVVLAGGLRPFIPELAPRDLQQGLGLDRMGRRIGRRGERYVAYVSGLKGRKKLRNGLFLEEIVLAPDSVEFRVFASRPIQANELSSLRLTDDQQTSYAIDLPPALDGHACIRFTPGPPSGRSRLHLSEPGWGLHIVANGDT